MTALVWPLPGWAQTTVPPRAVLGLDLAAAAERLAGQIRGAARRAGGYRLGDPLRGRHRGVPTLADPRPPLPPGPDPTPHPAGPTGPRVVASAADRRVWLYAAAAVVLLGVMLVGSQCTGGS